MAATVPFQVITASVSGKTIAINVASTSVATTLDSTGGFAPSVLVVAAGPAGVTPFVRMSSEAAPVATAADIPVPCGTVRLFANPAPNGKLGVAAIVSLTSTAVNVFFSPGQGGI